ncbi:MAG: hypothetical protein GC161_08800 [Planctomycetaceae bacterium]|nr:hypothetical protein [Planctomycetaceae bacterium]
MGAAKLALVGAVVALGLGLAFYLKAPRAIEDPAERVPVGIDAAPEPPAAALLPVAPAPALRDATPVDEELQAQEAPAPAAITEGEDAAEYVTVSVPKALWEEIRARADIPKPGVERVLDAKGTFIEGVPHGEWEITYVSGSVGRGPYVFGQKHGRWRFYDASGVEVQRGHFQEGLPAGIWESRDPDGSMRMHSPPVH